MRPLAIFPALCALVAVVLGFLCIYAGHSKGFMDDYHILSLNTSRIGRDLVSKSSSSSTSSSSSSSALDWLSNTASDIGSEITDELNDALNSVVSSVADELGLQDFYSAYMMDYCWGDYTPQAVPNATVSAKDITRNVSACSNSSSSFYFNPSAALERSLNQSGTGITLEDLNWPDDIQKGLDALRHAYHAMFALYCLAIGFSFVVLFASIAGALLARPLALVNVLLAFVGFLAFIIASAITTTVAVKGSNVINKYGDDIGIEAHRGGKFMAITWTGTVLLFLAMSTWCVQCWLDRRRGTGRMFSEKP